MSKRSTTRLPSPHVRVVVQSRLSSSRLPAKALLQLAGKPMVLLAAQRAANRGHEVVVATSTEPEDDGLVRALEAAGVVVRRGALADPLGRFVTATDDLVAGSLVVRLTADNLLPDGDLVDLLIQELVKRSLPYARVGGDALPYGLSAEAFTLDALRLAAVEAASFEDRAHVTPWLRRKFGDALLELPDVPEQWAGTRCTVDTFEDFVRVEALFSNVKDPVDAGWRELCDMLASAGPAAVQGWPERPRNTRGQSAVIAGTAQLGMDYGVARPEGPPTAKRAHQVMHAVAREGITHVDTARVYGLSEPWVGAALRSTLPQPLKVVTKLRPLDELPPDAHPLWCRAVVEASVGQSLAALGVQRVDTMLAHRAADWLREHVRDSLIDLREAGFFTTTGVSVQTPEELLEVLRYPDCGYVQMPFNILDHRWLDDSVQRALADRDDVTVTVRSVYLQGLLTVQSATWPQNTAMERADVQRVIDELVIELGRDSAADLCLAYVLGHPWVTSAVIGLHSPEHASELGRLGRKRPLSNHQIEHVRASLPTVSAELLDPSRWRHA